MSKNFKRKTRNNYIVPKIQLFFSSEKKYDFEIFKRGKIQKSRLTFLLCFCQFEFLDKKWTFGTLCCEKGWKKLFRLAKVLLYSYCSYLISHVPFGLFTLVWQLGRESDFVQRSLLDFLVHRLFNPFEFFLQIIKHC